MGVLKHSPTLVYAHSRSSPYLLFALAVSLARPQVAAAAPTGKTPKGQGAEQPGAIEQEVPRLFVWLTSSVSSHLINFCPEGLRAPDTLLFAADNPLLPESCRAKVALVAGMDGDLLRPMQTCDTTVGSLFCREMQGEVAIHSFPPPATLSIPRYVVLIFLQLNMYPSSNVGTRRVSPP
jgi:hypothetical protein